MIPRRDDWRTCGDEKHVFFFECPDGRVSCNLMASWQTMRHWASKFATVVRAVSPLELVEEIREEIRKAADNYDMT